MRLGAALRVPGVYEAIPKRLVFNQQAVMIGILLTTLCLQLIIAIGIWQLYWRVAVLEGAR